jgi:glycosyltransferase involved in cell wall biosynthesis
MEVQTNKSAESEKIMLSIIIPVYNHEFFIEKAIRSVLMQKVNFRYEVFVGEDCSTDNSRAVLKELEKELPPNFTILYREKNLGSGNFTDLRARTSGKYFACLEGDDYWTYPEKLQKQIDFLESHPDYIAVSHIVEFVDRNENHRYILGGYQGQGNEEYTLYDYRRSRLPGQTAAVIERNNCHGEIFKNTVPIPKGFPGDQNRFFMLAAHGKVRVIQEVWSCYRLVTEGGSSWSANPLPKEQLDRNDFQYWKDLYEFCLSDIKTKDSILVSESMYLEKLWGFATGKRTIKIPFKSWLKEFFRAKYKFQDSIYLTRRIITPTFRNLYQNSKFFWRLFVIYKKIRREDYSRIECQFNK